MNLSPTLPPPSLARSETFRFASSIWISGGICGKLWMPNIAGGKPIRFSARGPWGFYTKGDSFRDALSSILTREGGDFRSALFTYDTEIRIERKTLIRP